MFIALARCLYPIYICIKYFSNTQKYHEYNTLENNISKFFNPQSYNSTNKTVDILTKPFVAQTFYDCNKEYSLPFFLEKLKNTICRINANDCINGTILLNYELYKMNFDILP